MNPIRSMDYCDVVSSKGMKGSGLSVGQVVLVTATKVVPEKRNDPYLQRVYVLCMLVEDGVHLVPKEGEDHMQYLIDPRCLERVSEERAEEYREMLREQYGQVG